MWEDEREKYRAMCDEKGISWARSVLPNRVPEIQVHIREWIDERERKEAAIEAEVQRQLSREAIDAARAAAETSRESAVAARRSAFWTMWAAIAAAISAAVPLLQAAGVLPH